MHNWIKKIVWYGNFWSRQGVWVFPPCFSARKGVLKFMRNDHLYIISNFSRLGLFRQDFRHIKKVAYIRIAWNDKSVTIRCLGMLSIFFTHSGHFSQVFVQLKEWFFLELHKMIRVPDAVTCLFFSFALRSKSAGRRAKT